MASFATGTNADYAKAQTQHMMSGFRGAAPIRSQFGPDSAQPKQPQPQGTPYNPQQGQPFGAWGQQPMPQRPPAFESRTQNFDGTQSQMPNFQQRDAFIQQINNQLGQMQSQSWNQPMGAPQFNFGQMWQQAGQMAQDGWQNPFRWTG